MNLGGIIVLFILIAALTAVLVQLFASYHTQVRILRKFFRNKSVMPEDYLTLTSKLADIPYDSALDGGTLDLYFRNDSVGAHPLLVWIHGGGYMGGDKSCAEAWGRIISYRTGAVVASINYRLAPEQHYPGPILQAGEAIKHLLHNAETYGIDPTRIFLAGDSAGAQIASQCAAMVTSPLLSLRMKLAFPLTPAQLKGIVLCCGMYDMDTVVKTGFPAIKTFLWVYTDEKKFLTRYKRLDELSTVKHITPEYPPVFLTCGDADPFLPQSHELMDALAAAGVECDALLFDGSGKKLNHEYQFKLGRADANFALCRAVEFIVRKSAGLD